MKHGKLCSRLIDFGQLAGREGVLDDLGHGAAADATLGVRLPTTLRICYIYTSATCTPSLVSFDICSTCK